MEYLKLAIIINILFATTIYADVSEEVSVAIDLFSMDMEDKCNELTLVQKQYLLNTSSISNKIETEKNIGNFIKDESKRLRETHDTSTAQLSEQMQRQWTIAMKMGDAELPEESWNKLIVFKNSNEELSANVQISCVNTSKQCVLARNESIRILSTSHDAKELQRIWSSLQEVYPKNNVQEFPEILKLIQKAAEINDEANIQTYWETLVEYEEAYTKANQFWSEIEPLYNKFHNFVKRRLEKYYDLSNSTSIPVYLLGSEFGTDWSNIAPLVLPHRYLYDEIISMLEFDKIGGRKMYEIAENFTSSMGFGNAKPEFWKNSIFNHKCPSHLLTFCGEKYTSVITCNVTGWKEYLDAHEDMVQATLNNMNYPITAFNSYRISVLDEALADLSSILALKNLPQSGIVPESVFMDSENSEDNQMTALMLTALRVLPRLPFYLLADNWRFQQLEKDNKEPPIESWWALRESMQHVKGVSNMEPDFLGDSYINSNKPYIGKFLATLLQFQLFEHFQSELSDGVNILTHMSNDESFRTMLKQRGSKKWSEVLYNNLYYEVETDSILNYFRPLEEYMDSAPVEQITQTVIPKTTTTTTTTTTTQKPKSSTTDAPLPKLPKIESLDNRKENIRVLPTSQKPPVLRKESVILAVDSSEKPTEPPSTSASTTATWIGGLIGVGALLIIAVVVGRKRCRRKPLPHNRRHEV